MADLTDHEIDIIHKTNRAIKWRPYTRVVEFAVGIGLLCITLWAAYDRAVFEWLTSGGGLFGLLGGLAGSATMAAVRNWGHKRDKLLTKLAASNELSVTQ